MRWRIALFACGLVALGCQDAPQVKKDVDAGVDKPVMNQHIADAVASVAGSGDPAGPATDDQGPPPNGVFPPGEADKRQPADAPLEAQMITDGADPKLKLLPLKPFDKPQRVDVTAAFVEGRGIKAVIFELEATIPKPEVKEPAEGEGQPGEGKPAEGEDQPKGDDKPKVMPITTKTPIHFKVLGVRAHQQVPLSEGEIERYNTLEGTKISAVIMKNGGLTGETFELSKKADDSTHAAVRAVVDTISLFFSPLPDKPVGVGAYWIAGDRASMGGLDLVRYRVTKVEQMKGDELILTVQLRLYAAGPGSVPPGTPEGAIALKFDGQGNGAMSRRQGQLLPIEGQLQAPLQLQYAASKDAQLGQLYQVQYQAGWQPHRPPAKDGEKKAP